MSVRPRRRDRDGCGQTVTESCTGKSEVCGVYLFIYLFIYLTTKVPEVTNVLTVHVQINTAHTYNTKDMDTINIQC